MFHASGVLTGSPNWDLKYSHPRGIMNNVVLPSFAVYESMELLFRYGLIKVMWIERFDGIGIIN